MQSYDLIVIGSGPAGQRAAIHAAKLGKRVALVERKDVIGGTCINTGTIPSKTMREAVLHLSGLPVPGHLRDQLPRQGEDHHGGPVLPGPAGDQERDRRHAGAALAQRHRRCSTGRPASWIRTSSRSRAADGETDVPGRRVHHRHRHEGRRVAGRAAQRPHDRHERPDAADARAPEDAHRRRRRRHRRRVRVACSRRSACAWSWSRSGRGCSSSPTRRSSRRSAITCATPRHPAAGRRGRQGRGDRRSASSPRSRARRRSSATRCSTPSAGTATSSSSTWRPPASRPTSAAASRSTREYRTKQPHIFAVGDVIGFPSLASVSMEQGRIAAGHAVGMPVDSNPASYPYGIYTIPEISFVGKTEEQLTEEDVPYETGLAYYREIARGQIRGDTTGRLKLIFHRETREMLGVHIIGEGAAELLHIGQAVLAFEGTVDYFVEHGLQLPDAGGVLQDRGVQRAQQARAVLMPPALATGNNPDGTRNRRSRDGAHRGGAGGGPPAWSTPIRVYPEDDTRRRTRCRACRPSRLRRPSARRSRRSPRGHADRGRRRGFPRHHPQRYHRGVAQPAADEGLQAGVHALGAARQHGSPCAS